MNHNNNKDNKGGDTLDMGIQRIEIDLRRFEAEPDYANLPLLPTRNLVLVPGVTITVALGRESS
ncbi:MAG: hypothetical protein K2L28_06745, partial [Muribaculaceae bacterium]|nr:hypothetical protein [Muribaculaceae bacterium]